MKRRDAIKTILGGAAAVAAAPVLPPAAPGPDAIIAELIRNITAGPPLGWKLGPIPGLTEATITIEGVWGVIPEPFASILAEDDVRLRRLHDDE